MKKNPNLTAREITISYKSEIQFSSMPQITSAKDAEKIFRQIWSPSIELREECYALFLNRANRVLGWFLVSVGGISGTVIDPRLLFSTALTCHAVGIVIAHSHPSGNTQPSASDKQLTKNLVDGGRLLEISVLDHLILTSSEYFSFTEEGLI